jgi:hypothetical protein
VPACAPGSSCIPTTRILAPGGATAASGAACAAGSPAKGLDDRLVFGRQHGAGRIEQAPAGRQEPKGGAQDLQLQMREVRDVLLPAQDLDVWMAPDDAGRRTGHIHQNALKGPAVPEALWMANVGDDERGVPAAARKIFLNPRAARRVAIQCHDLA